MIDLFAKRGRWGNLPSIADRIDATGDCWLWTGSLSSGYGRVRDENWKPEGVHRLMWETLVGPIPDDMQIDHLCRVRHCCNPDHLEVVTLAENIRRGAVGFRNKSKTHCPRSHPYSKENTYVWSDGGRKCRACNREKEAERRLVDDAAAEGETDDE